MVDCPLPRLITRGYVPRYGVATDVAELFAGKCVMKCGPSFAPKRYGSILGTAEIGWLQNI